MSTTSSEVSMGDYSTASRKALYTDALKTCTRIAVVGSYSNGSHGKDRFLAHIAEDFDPIEDDDTILDEFIEKIKHAKNNGLVIEEVVVLKADYAMEQGFDPDDKEALDEFNQQVIHLLEQGIGFRAKVAYHSTGVKYEMQITEDKEIWFRREIERSGEKEEDWVTYSEWTE